MKFSEFMARMRRKGTAHNREGMKRFAITGSKLYGSGVPFVRKLAGRARKEVKEEKKRNALARRLWASGVHEGKLAATMIAEPSIGWRTAEKWISQCRNWAEVDQLCSNLLWKMKGVDRKALQYTRVRELWKKRTGFVLMAVLAVRRRGELKPKLANAFFAAIERESKDERNFVRKAVNWALRQVGKSTNARNWRKALVLARKLAAGKDKTARWIGSDAKRELEEKGPWK